MIDLSEDALNHIRDQLSEVSPTAVGYRLMIRPIPARQGLEAVEAEKFKKLAEAGFTTKSKDQESKESHGSDVGIVVDCGQDTYSYGALKDAKGRWCEEGDVVIFPRYSGHRCELPPGSGKFYQFMNDDDIVGKYEGVTYE